MCVCVCVLCVYGLTHKDVAARACVLTGMGISMNPGGYLMTWWCKESQGIGGLISKHRTCSFLGVHRQTVCVCVSAGWAAESIGKKGTKD